jgi:hypothetical protein
VGWNLFPCGIHSNLFQTLERRTLARGALVYKSVRFPGGQFPRGGVEWSYWFALPLRCSYSPEVPYVR